MSQETKICFYCNKDIEIDKIERHELECISTVDSSVTSTLIECDTCHKMIDFDEYQKHQQLCLLGGPEVLRDIIAQTSRYRSTNPYAMTYSFPVSAEPVPEPVPEPITASEPVNPVLDFSRFGTTSNQELLPPSSAPLPPPPPPEEPIGDSEETPMTLSDYLEYYRIHQNQRRIQQNQPQSSPEQEEPPSINVNQVTRMLDDMERQILEQQQIGHQENEEFSDNESGNDTIDEDDTMDIDFTLPPFVNGSHANYFVNLARDADNPDMLSALPTSPANTPIPPLDRVSRRIGHPSRINMNAIGSLENLPPDIVELVAEQQESDRTLRRQRRDAMFSNPFVRYSYDDDIKVPVNDLNLVAPLIEFTDITPKELEENICTICQDKYTNVPGKQYRRLVCNEKAVFCNECIKPWLAEHHYCPNCKDDLNLYVRQGDQVVKQEVNNAGSFSDGGDLFSRNPLIRILPDGTRVTYL